VELEEVVRRDRTVIIAGLVAVVGIAWIYLVKSAVDMRAMAAMDAQMAAMGMADMHAWGAADWVALFVMWAVMMAGMMLPSAAPVILLVLGVYRRRGDADARRSAAAFTAGYMAVWTAFSAAAAAVQVVLHRAALLSPDMSSHAARFAALLLVGAGVYQWLPVKGACLTHCQSPLGFLTSEWREGAAGAFTMGARHGGFCVGCCWALMALLFVLGVMNLLWVAAITAFVLIEKVLKRGVLLGRLAGVLLMAWGLLELIV
jgi:predicted metal-binding membrane protein